MHEILLETRIAEGEKLMLTIYVGTSIISKGRVVTATRSYLL